MVNTEVPSSNIDAYALFEALTGRKIDRPLSSGAMSEDYDVVQNENDSLGREPTPDSRPKDVHVGAINPYALVEAMIGHRLDRHSMSSARIISDVLQTDYDELFDLKHDSVLFAGLKLNRQDRRAEELDEKDTKILQEKDLVTPDLSRVQKLEDLEKLGLKGFGESRVKMARMQNGKLRLVVDADSIARTVNNRDITMTLNELATRFRREKGEWTPPNSEWRDVREALYQNIPQRIIGDLNRFSLNGQSYNGQYNNNNQISMNNCTHRNRFDDPVQGALSNSWLIAAIFSVFWANPSVINRAPRENHRRREEDNDEHNRRHRDRLQIKFHDKGGRNNSKTETVEVDFEVPVNNSSNDPVYCRSSDGADIWPSLYEKAFAKWMSNSRSERPDITQTAHGDPIKAMAQINGREPHYYFCDKHNSDDLVGLVRHCSVNFKTINPMAAYTHASGQIYRGTNLVANHAYSVLGWTNHGDRQYIILRNPWGVTEPVGLTSYPGLLDRVEPAFWRPACLLDQDGVLALEASSFKEYFSCIGVAK
ncbi:uncharacterized protein BCR38DRAFT_503387 [Pseudomassariella vexata]|uniref:Calpain catalytic domain-containing protein n=1 Tax=Pseudomassariella vexata TaxID=1141098 RepID=A0A1Y2EHB7_9PEZI|nr:uncharacterized protein BCR38DRAFT_503387 [Pseudomassariella vexata]ORY70185.1 hypothetical protein BCR38DRAFT_503387 [Pseudomassariella vexata]